MARHPIDLPGVPPPLARHIKALGLPNWQSYFGWCREHGFPESLEKTKRHMQQELEVVEQFELRRKAQMRLHKNPKAFLKAVCLGNVTSDEIDRPNFKRAATEIEGSNEAPEQRKSLLEMLNVLSRHSELIYDVARGEIPFIRGLIKLHDRRALWIRPIANFKPRSKNADRKFGELTHHLFDEYGDVPVFLERAWLRTDTKSWRWRDWYIHLGRGHNLRKAKSPVPITKKTAHFFLQAPDDYTVEQAIRWGQMRALGAEPPLINAVAATRLGRGFDEEEFWFTVLRFLADTPMLDPRQVGPVIDYIQNQKFEGREFEQAPGVWHREPAAQPGFSMRGRDAATLLRHVEDWHTALGKGRAKSDTVYPEAPFGGFSDIHKKGRESVSWVIRQLRSHRDLIAESDDLRHCVGSYHWSCESGRCTIWNLSSESGQGRVRRQTIEVNRNNEIVQCRGLANRDPSPEEWLIVRKWADAKNLRVATYL